MKKLWALRYVFGLLLGSGLVVVLLVTVVRYEPMWAGIAALIIVGGIIAIQPRVRKERERTRRLVDAAFRESYAQLPRPPSMKMSSSYGYPAFEVIFRSKADMDDAAMRNSQFKDAIDSIYKGYGPRSRPFRAEMAIFFTCGDYRAELRAQSNL